MNDEETSTDVDVDPDARFDWCVMNQEWSAAGNILQVNPSLCRKKPNDGETLLHWLCSLGGTPASILGLVASLYPEAIALPDRSLGDTCLHIAARNSQFSAAKLEVLLVHCDSTADTLLIRNYMGGTVLHSAANHNAVLEALQLLVQSNPALLKVNTHDGINAMAALWLAYVQTIPGHMTVVRILNGDTVESESFRRFWSKVEYLAARYFFSLTACPEDEKKTDYIIRKGYVLHALLRWNAPINLLKVCLNCRPESALVMDAAGNFPLHILIENRPYRLKERDAIECCIKSMPHGSAGVPNQSGCVPLHIAIRNKIPIANGVDLLLDAAPSMVRCRDIDTSLYPFQLAATQGNNASVLNTVFFLLTRQPDLVKPSLYS